MRIVQHPIVEQEQRPYVTIYMDGIPIKAKKGEPIAAALVANGIQTFRYTHKLGEPRGIFCGIGQCNDCAVIVDGKPNVRSCVTLVEEGMHVETQRGLGHMGVEQ